MKESIEKIILYSLLILIIAGLVYALTGFIGKGVTTNTIDRIASNPLPPDNTNKNTGSGYKTITTGTTGPGDVAIDLTPHKINNGQIEVDIAVNTHSVDLNQFDLKEITKLEFDDKSINPASAPILRGHHNAGTLVFEVGEDIDSFTIKIMGIPKVEERVFEWR